MGYPLSLQPFKLLLFKSGQRSRKNNEDINNCSSFLWTYRVIIKVIICLLSIPPSTLAKPCYSFGFCWPPSPVSAHVVWVEHQPQYQGWSVQPKCQPISPPHVSGHRIRCGSNRGVFSHSKSGDYEKIQEEHSITIPPPNEKNVDTPVGSNCERKR